MEYRRFFMRLRDGRHLVSAGFEEAIKDEISSSGIHLQMGAEAEVRAHSRSRCFRTHSGDGRRPSAASLAGDKFPLEVGYRIPILRR